MYCTRTWMKMLLPLLLSTEWCSIECSKTQIKLIANTGRWAWKLVPEGSVAEGQMQSKQSSEILYPCPPCEREPPLYQSANRHHHTERNSVENHTYLTKALCTCTLTLRGREGREPESTNIHTTVMICMFSRHTDPESPSPRLTRLFRYGQFKPHLL